VVDVDVHNIPSPGMKFKPFAEILTGKWKPDILVREFVINLCLHIVHFKRVPIIFCGNTLC